MGAPTSEVGLHYGHNQEGGPQSLYGHVVALGEKNVSADANGRANKA
jgi:hypothetical protein